MKKIVIAAMAIMGVVTAGASKAEDNIKIGVSVGLTGYAATADNGWRDGVMLAADYLNAHGGILNRQIIVQAEDNRSEPQEAVTIYKKLITSDKVDILVNGVLSAGNFAGAPLAVQAEIPMLLGSILPKPPAQEKWAFTPITPPAFEIEKRLEYIRDYTSIKKIAVLSDPSPYGKLQSDIAEKRAESFGLTLVANERYKQDDADLSTQIIKTKEAGAGAILKIGLGGTTLTAAKNIKQLGFDVLLLTSLEDVAVFKPVSEVLGDKFFFVASPPQIYDLLDDSQQKKAIWQFLEPWRAKYGQRDPNWAVRGWDSVMIAAEAMKKAQTTEGAKVRDAIEKLSGLQGAGGIYNFSPTAHFGMTENPLSLMQISGGALVFAK
ncbi:ABC transporter substrate-binding protein [Phyllobacterium sp. SB3]|uniref:ABC transporter substrate-binding protein n=1 Tax=Phyllobacterium sp. SB3 TaxID=3156073 RepID=UPI0032AF8E86